MVQNIKLCSKFSQVNRHQLYFIIRFAFVTFANESDCADALKAHTQIGGAKVNVSYAFAKAEKPQNTDSNKNQEKKPTTPTQNTNKQQTKPGLNWILLLFSSLFNIFS